MITSTKNNTVCILQTFVMSLLASFLLISNSYSNWAAGFEDIAYDTQYENWMKRYQENIADNHETSHQQLITDQEKNLTYQFNSGTHDLIRQKIIDYYAKFSLEFADFLRKADLVKIYRKEVHKQGFDKNSITDADAYLWIQAWQTVHYKEEPDITPEMIEAVRRQFKLIGIDRKLHEFRDEFQQIYAEAKITQAMLILSLLQHGLQSNDQTSLANMIQAARGSVEGIDNYKLTNKGFEVKKEILSPSGAQLGDVYFNQLSSVTISKAVEKNSSVAKTVVVVKTANYQWFQRHADGRYSIWDKQIASLKNNNYSGSTSNTINYDITESLDLSSAPVLLPLMVYIGNIYDDGQLHWGYFNVKSLPDYP